jgi:hypothetical protein
MRAEEAEKQRAKELQQKQAEEVEKHHIKELREKEEHNREIDRRITAYSQLTAPNLNLTYGQLYFTVMGVYPIARWEKRCIDPWETAIRAWYYQYPTDKVIPQGRNPHIHEAAEAIKKDVIAMMDIYEGLYRHPHPRREEFSQM